MIFGLPALCWLHRRTLALSHDLTPSYDHTLSHPNMISHPPWSYTFTPSHDHHTLTWPYTFTPSHPHTLTWSYTFTPSHPHTLTWSSHPHLIKRSVLAAATWLGGPKRLDELSVRPMPYVYEKASLMVQRNTAIVCLYVYFVCVPLAKDLNCANTHASQTSTHTTHCTGASAVPSGGGGLGKQSCLGCFEASSFCRHRGWDGKAVKTAVGARAIRGRPRAGVKLTPGVTCNKEIRSVCVNKGNSVCVCVWTKEAGVCAWTKATERVCVCVCVYKGNRACTYGLFLAGIFSTIYTCFWAGAICSGPCAGVKLAPGVKLTPGL